MKPIVIFSFLGNEVLANEISDAMHAEIGNSIIDKFPDGESYVRILTEVKDKCLVIICSLNEPNEKLLELYFFCKTAKALGAKKVLLVAPYLAYMRQDKMFHSGEAVTSTYAAEFIEKFVDGIITIDPHLHRIKSLTEVYKIPNSVIHANTEISKWIKKNIHNPIIIGPDIESKQWVSQVAKRAEAPFMVLTKTRLSASEVKISIPKMALYKNETPVLVDDIISTAHTMIETIKLLKEEGMKPAVCIGIHAVFAGNAYQELMDSGVAKIVTCNTISHPSNAIDLSNILIKDIKKLISKWDNAD